MSYTYEGSNHSENYEDIILKSELSLSQRLLKKLDEVAYLYKEIKTDNNGKLFRRGLIAQKLLELKDLFNKVD